MPAERLQGSAPLLCWGIGRAKRGRKDVMQTVRRLQKHFGHLTVLRQIRAASDVKVKAAVGYAQTHSHNSASAPPPHQLHETGIPYDSPFSLLDSMRPQGDQAEAISQLVHALQNGQQTALLRGATGTGKHFIN